MAISLARRQRERREGAGLQHARIRDNAIVILQYLLLLGLLDVASPRSSILLTSDQDAGQRRS